MVTDTMPRPFGPIADDLSQRTEWTVEFFHSAFRRPEFVGWHYCGLIDADNRSARKAGRQHSGLVDGLGAPYAELQTAIEHCADAMYAIATRGA